MGALLGNCLPFKLCRLPPKAAANVRRLFLTAKLFLHFFSPSEGRPLSRGGCKYRTSPAPVQGPRRVFSAPQRARPRPQFGKGDIQAGPSSPNPGTSRAAFGSRTRPQGIIFFCQPAETGHTLYTWCLRSARQLAGLALRRLGASPQSKRCVKRAEANHAG